ncbi:MAG: hypothetical protein ACOCUR_01890 [Nanoarchaeota archaeon]
MIDNKDLKTYECNDKDLQVCIEARQNNSFWEIYKTYRSESLTFTEEYEATNSEEAKDIIKRMKNEVVDQKTLKRIDNLRKNLAMKMKRVFKEENVEKWKFSINSEKFENIIIIRYGKEIEMDIIANEKLKFIETEILDEIYRILGMADFNSEVVQNIYFFSKRSSFFNDAEDRGLLNRIEVGFKFESDGDEPSYFDSDI